MKIIINEQNKSKIEAILNEVQAKSRARNMNIDDIYDCLKYIIDRLEITKKALEGTTVYYDKNAQTFPNCYKGIPESTQISITFDKGNWKLNRIYRGRTEKYRYELHLSETAKEAVIKNYSKF